MKHRPVPSPAAWFVTAFALSGCPLTLRAGSVGGFDFQLIDGGAAVEIVRYTLASSAPAVVPAEINGKPVPRLADNAFRNHNLVPSITIPSSVVSLGGQVFYQCTALKDVSIPSSVTSIGFEPFGGCTQLNNVVLPASIGTIPTYAF